MENKYYEINNGFIKFLEGVGYQRPAFTETYFNLNRIKKVSKRTSQFTLGGSWVEQVDIVIDGEVAIEFDKGFDGEEIEEVLLNILRDVNTVQSRLSQGGI